MTEYRSDRPFVGYVTEITDGEGRMTINRNFEFKFTFVVDHGGKINGEWVPNKVFYTVAVYNRLARNIMATFARQPKQGVGLRLIIVGYLRESRVRGSVNHHIPRRTIVANYAGPDLTWNVAAIVPMGPDTTDDALDPDTSDQALATAAA